MRAKSINVFEMLGWSATGLGLLSVLITLIVALSQRPGLDASGVLLLLYVLLLFSALGVVTFYAAKRRLDVGRWGFVVVAAVLAVLLVMRIDGFTLVPNAMGALYIILDTLTLAAMMGATICLLQPDAQAWFPQGPIQPSPPQTGQPPFPGYGAPPVAGGAYPPASYPPTPGYPPQPLPDAAHGAAYPPAAADPVVLTASTRRCPFCAEDIKAEASKCRFCGSAVEPLAR